MTEMAHLSPQPATHRKSFCARRYPTHRPLSRDGRGAHTRYLAPTQLQLAAKHRVNRAHRRSPHGCSGALSRDRIPCLIAATAAGSPRWLCFGRELDGFLSSESVKAGPLPQSEHVGGRRERRSACLSGRHRTARQLHWRRESRRPLPLQDRRFSSAARASPRATSLHAAARTDLVPHAGADLIAWKPSSSGFGA